MTSKPGQAERPVLFSAPIERLQLQYDEVGSGPLVVLLHGFPESRASWKRQMPALAAAGFHAVAPDLPGYGDSPSPRGIAPYSLMNVARDVALLIESLGGPCVLVAHDWGAAVAWTVAVQRPDLLRKLVILNVPPPGAIAREIRRNNSQKLRLLYQLFFQLPLLPELFMKLFGKSLMRRAGRFDEEEVRSYARQWRGHLTPMLNYYRAMRKSGLGGSRERIETPTLLIHGKREPVFLPASFEELDRWVANVRLEHVDRAGHFVQRDQPERVSELIIEFARG